MWPANPELAVLFDCTSLPLEAELTGNAGAVVVVYATPLTYLSCFSLLLCNFYG